MASRAMARKARSPEPAGADVAAGAGVDPDGPHPATVAAIATAVATFLKCILSPLVVLCAAGEFARLGMHLHLFAFLDEERDADFQPGLQRRELGDAAAGGVAAHTRFGRDDRELDVWRELQADGVAVVFLDLYDDVVDEELAIVAEH